MKALLIMRCIELTGSDDRMDCGRMFYDPINTLPPKCRKCGYPDIDSIPQPYFLIKSRTMSPNELAQAAHGNLLVRARVRQVLKIVAPRQVEFFPTCYKGTTEETPWYLTVPTHMVVTGKVSPSIPRCNACHEPRSAHPGTQYSERLTDIDSTHDILKSSNWASSELGWDKWMSRKAIMSVRLFHLLKKIKSRGLYETTCAKPKSPDKQESEWIRKKLEILKKQGIAQHSPGTLSEGDAKWLRDYIKSHTRKRGPTLDIKSVPRRLNFRLPKSYVEFITKVGPCRFDDVDEQQGCGVQILAPKDLDSKHYRAGALEDANDETNAVDGVMFAQTPFGDCFCFDVQKGNKEFPVFLYKHEYNFFEPYAENFAACIRRFAGSVIV